MGLSKIALSFGKERGRRGAASAGGIVRRYCVGPKLDLPIMELSKGGDRRRAGGPPLSNGHDRPFKFLLEQRECDLRLAVRLRKDRHSSLLHDAVLRQVRRLFGDVDVADTTLGG